MKINGNGSIAQGLGNEVLDQVAKRADPLNLFSGDKMSSGCGSGLVPRGAGGAGGIDELLASLSKKDKNSSFDTASAGDNLNKGGINPSSGSGGCDPAGGAGGAGASKAMGAIMGIVKQLLPMIMGMLGGL